MGADLPQAVARLREQHTPRLSSINFCSRMSPAKAIRCSSIWAPLFRFTSTSLSAAWSGWCAKCAPRYIAANAKKLRPAARSNNSSQRDMRDPDGHAALLRTGMAVPDVPGPAIEKIRPIDSLAREIRLQGWALGNSLFDYLIFLRYCPASRSSLKCRPLLWTGVGRKFQANSAHALHGSPAPVRSHIRCGLKEHTMRHRLFSTSPTVIALDRLPPYSPPSP